MSLSVSFLSHNLAWHLDVLQLILNELVFSSNFLVLVFSYFLSHLGSLITHDFF